MTDRQMILKKKTIFGSEMLVIDWSINTMYVYVHPECTCIHKEEISEEGIKSWIGQRRVTGYYI